MSKNDNANIDIERHQCELATLFIGPAAQLGKFDEMLAKEDLSRYARYEIWLDSADARRLLVHSSTPSRLLEQPLFLAADVKDASDNAIVSVRLKFRPTAKHCRRSVLNPARHRCAICLASFGCNDGREKNEEKQCCKQYCPRESNLQIKRNARQTIDHFSRVAFYSEGDGKAYPQHAIVKEPEEPGKSLLKEADALDHADAYRDPAETHVPFQIFTSDRPALVPRAAAPMHRNKNYTAFGVPINQHACARDDCVEDHVDVNKRQQAGFFERHYPAQATRQELFVTTSVQKGVDKRQLAALQASF